MFSLLCSLIRLLVFPGRFREIALENLALRQQLTVFKRHPLSRDCNRQIDCRLRVEELIEGKGFGRMDALDSPEVKV